MSDIRIDLAELKFECEAVERIADHYGYALQTRQLLEEMGELAQAVNKHYKYVNALPFGGVNMRSKAREHVIDEIADVQIMLWQIAYLLRADVESVVNRKLHEHIDYLNKED